MASQLQGKYYAVRKGRHPGVYLDWDSCKAEVNGYKGSQYKSFRTRSEAEQYLTLNHKVSDSILVSGSKDVELTNRKETAISEKETASSEKKPVTDGVIYADGGCNGQTGKDAWASVVNSEGVDLIPSNMKLLSDFKLLEVELPIKGGASKRTVITVRFDDVSKQQNNGAELVAAIAAFRIALEKKNIKTVCSDSQLIVDYWSKVGFKPKAGTDPKKAKLISELAELRSKFNLLGGQLVKISGDDNLADLGYHK